MTAKDAQDELRTTLFLQRPLLASSRRSRENTVKPMCSSA